MIFAANHRLATGLATLALIALMPTNAPASPLIWDCDTPANHFSSLSMEITAPTQVSGVINADKLLKGEQFVPNVSVLFRNLDEHEYSGFSMSLQHSDDEFLTVFIRRRQHQSDEQEVIATVSRLTPVTFSLSISADGKTQLDLNDHSYQLTSELTHAQSVRITCSTGDFKFSSLMLSESGSSLRAPQQ